MMKKISAYLSNLLLVMMCFMFAACPSDSDSEPVPEPEKDLGIIGTWRYEFSSGYIYLYFGKTGFGWEHEYDEADGGWYEKDRFTYVYDATEKRIAIKWEDDDSEVVVVSALSEDRMALEDFGDSGLNFYDRVSDGEYKTGDEEDEPEPEPKPEPDKTKRLVKIEERDFEEDEEYLMTYTFEYDNQGNVIYVLEYDLEDYYTKEFTEFSYTGNTISFQVNNEVSWDERVTFDLSDDKICYAKREYYNDMVDKWKLDWEFNYEYNSLGLLKQINQYSGSSEYQTDLTWKDYKLQDTEEYGSESRTFKYGNKTCKGYNPIIVFYYDNVFTPIVAKPELLGLRTNQLPISMDEDGDILTFSYEFYEDGYLKKCEAIWEDEYEGSIYTFTWE